MKAEAVKLITHQATHFRGVFLLAVLTVILSACSGPIAPPGLKNDPASGSKSVKSTAKSKPMNALQSVKKPVSVAKKDSEKGDETLLVLSENQYSVMHDGKAVDLAVHFLASNTNPFFNILAEVDIPEPDSQDPTEAVAEMPQFHDPLDGIKLLGILYSKVSPMALLAFDDDEEKQTIVHLHDVLEVENERVQVQSILANEIKVKNLDGVGLAKERVITLPNIVGFDPSSTPSVTDKPQNNNPQNNHPQENITESAEKGRHGRSRKDILRNIQSLSDEISEP